MVRFILEGSGSGCINPVGGSLVYKPVKIYPTYYTPEPSSSGTHERLSVRARLLRNDGFGSLRVVAAEDLLSY